MPHILLRGVNHYKCKWIKDASIIVSKESIHAVLPWDVDGMNDGYCLMIKGYSGIIEPYAITQGHFEIVSGLLGLE